MASQNKFKKTDRRNHPGIGGSFLKSLFKLKRCAFYNASYRKSLKRQLNTELAEI